MAFSLASTCLASFFHLKEPGQDATCKMQPASRRQLFASLLQEVDILRPSLGHGITNRIQFSSSSSALLMGRFMFIIYLTASQYLIAFCCLIPKPPQTHFFVAVGEHCSRRRNIQKPKMSFCKHRFT